MVSEKDSQSSFLSKMNRFNEWATESFIKMANLFKNKAVVYEGVIKSLTQPIRLKCESFSNECRY